MQTYLFKVQTKIGTREIQDTLKVMATSKTVAHCAAMTRIEKHYKGFNIQHIRLQCYLIKGV